MDFAGLIAITARLRLVTLAESIRHLLAMGEVGKI